MKSCAYDFRDIPYWPRKALCKVRSLMPVSRQNLISAMDSRGVVLMYSTAVLIARVRFAGAIYIAPGKWQAAACRHTKCS